MIQVVILRSVHLFVVLHQPLRPEDINLSANLRQPISQHIILQSGNGLLLNFLDFLCLLVISLWLLFSCFVPISFLGFAFILNFLDLLRCDGIMRYYKSRVSYGLQLISRLLLQVDSLLAQIQQHGPEHAIRLSAVRGHLARL